MPAGILGLVVVRMSWVRKGAQRSQRRMAVRWAKENFDMGAVMAVVAEAEAFIGYEAAGFHALFTVGPTYRIGAGQ